MSEQSAVGEYRVLARKYRPQTFADMIGQEALVRTLTNAIQSGRIAHAFMLTGVRGVGKTTTARIVARALNCTGEDGTGGPTPMPCGKCDACVSIAADRHPDVMEMDAASRTGVDDIREIIDGVRYRPISARYKIYIIDEVHMLSKNAFNALLKTLEEPPEHTKFLFATTEIRKVPVTVLSRCQRFDLRRIEPTILAAYFTGVATKEGWTLDPEAADLIARAADGSARDGMSLLDQAISLSTGGTVTVDQVRGMLGLADRLQVYDVFRAIMAGEVATALDLSVGMHRAGADPTQVIQDLLEVCHAATRLKVAPAASEGLSGGERQLAEEFGKTLSVASLSRAWQMLLKGAEEVGRASNAQAALEMVLIRLGYISDLPNPADLLKRLTEGGGLSAGGSPAPNGGGGGAPRMVVHQGGGSAAVARALPQSAPTAPNPQTFDDVVALFGAMRESQIRVDLLNHVRLVKFEPGRIEFEPSERASRDLAGRVSNRLTEWTGHRWIAIVSGSAASGITLREQANVSDGDRRSRILALALTQRILSELGGNADDMQVKPYDQHAFDREVLVAVPDAGDTDADLDYSVEIDADSDDFLDSTF
ncbi:DNA polymerase III subunit gamma/tau [Lacibacterium aquatile]|uniref:DNA polymerase III subunit gamma/tau n=1 Tax=Lacibacterium aquatile TaxID=1168082 RepID=A0ABW5DLZ6_9PROT